MESWRLLPFGKADAVENMAVDEAVLREAIRKRVPPTLRFYSWRTPTVSIGYFQRARREIDLEACRRLGIDFIRRPTGGKAVLHDREVTYAVIAGADHPLFPPDILRSFRVISGCIARGLLAIGIKAEMKAEGRAAADESLRTSCFSSPSRYELLVKAGRYAGRLRCGPMAFCSSTGPADGLRSREDLCGLAAHRDPERQAALLRDSVTAVEEQAGGPWTSGNSAVSSGRLRAGARHSLRGGAADADEETLKRELMAKKYSSENWNVEGSKSWISGY